MPPVSNNGSLEVVSLVTDEPLLLRMESDSSPFFKGDLVWIGNENPENPEKDDEADRRPFRCIFFSREPENGRLSGNRAFTRVTISDGQITKKGWISTVSRGEEMVFASERNGFDP